MASKETEVAPMSTVTKQAMTPQEAQSFQGMSIANSILVASHFRACGCQAYSDVFTFNRWLALGFVVRKGEKALKLPIVKHIERKDKDTGEITEGRILGASFVFCKHQVEARS